MYCKSLASIFLFYPISSSAGQRLGLRRDSHSLIKQDSISAPVICNCKRLLSGLSQSEACWWDVRQPGTSQIRGDTPNTSDPLANVLLHFHTCHSSGSCCITDNNSAEANQQGAQTKAPLDSVQVLVAQLWFSLSASLNRQEAGVKRVSRCESA